jgi:hypothetical protein
MDKYTNIVELKQVEREDIDYTMLLFSRGI